MKRNRIRPAAACFVALLATATTTTTTLADGPDHGRTLRAYARIDGPGGIRGIVTFKQRACPGCPSPGLDAPATHPGFHAFPEPTVEVVARISGPAGVLVPGAHGMHLHEVGVCEPPGFTTAMGHFDPGPRGHSNPVDFNHPYHMGDLPNLIVNGSGAGFMKHTTSRITLSPGALSVFDADGTAVIVHMNPDRGLNNIAGASGGPRIACGVLQVRSFGELDEDDD